ncbi:MAG: DUF1553 domain-containing protein [Acidobacteria bacterium]|nr:DUF1553 domain-containing protein [Acidobacteriota bacterium]
MPHKPLRFAQATLLGCLGLFILGFLAKATEEEETEVTEVTAKDCTYSVNPDEFLAREGRAQEEVFDRALKVQRALAAAETRGAGEIPHRGFIDSEIFGRLAKMNVSPARLATDEEFVRRIYLDLTGRIPYPEDVRAFAADPNRSKRDELIERLLNSPEFVDRWTMWLGDLLQITSNSTNINRELQGRDAFQAWLKSSVASNKSFKDIAYEAVSAWGNTFDPASGAANFAVGATTPMGPVQDTYDTMLVKSATAFLGMAYYDCLLCHNGRAHLDSISLYFGTATRAEAWGMAAHFSRLRMIRDAAPQGDPRFNSFNVASAATGDYNLNTSAGNRPPRTPIGTARTAVPRYRNGAAPQGPYWRERFGEQMVWDPMFARNLVNRLWKHFFNLGLVDPVETLDPARLDPQNPPPAPWALQATHPELLEKLAQQFVASNFSLRGAIRLIAQSSAYQLSSRYDQKWKVEYVPLFARHYPRRLDAEEIHDAVVKGTRVFPFYELQGRSEPVTFAMQMPDTAEPRGNGAAAFMNAFLRGNRDTRPRRQNGSILQQLSLMNDNFVLNRVRITTSPVLMEAAQIQNNEASLEHIYLALLSRAPSAKEREAGVAHLRRAASTAARNQALEDLAWAAINKTEFLFSY